MKREAKISVLIRHYELNPRFQLATRTLSISSCVFGMLRDMARSVTMSFHYA